MEKLLFFAFVLSPGVLFAFLRVPEPPTLTPTLTPALTLAAQTPCQVAAVYPLYKTSPGVTSERVERFVGLPADTPRKLN